MSRVSVERMVGRKFLVAFQDLTLEMTPPFVYVSMLYLYLYSCLSIVECGMWRVKACGTQYTLMHIDKTYNNSGLLACIVTNLSKAPSLLLKDKANHSRKARGLLKLIYERCCRGPRHPRRRRTGADPVGTWNKIGTRGATCFLP